MATRRAAQPHPELDPEAPPCAVEVAVEAGLRYVSSAEAGLSRQRRGRSFGYRRADGSAVRDRATLERIRSLAIPPAWTKVWICADADGHLQATGRDAKGRKQYRYHPRWREVRDAGKFEQLGAFGAGLADLRARLDADMAGRSLSATRVVATVVWLLDHTLIRVGNEEYARSSESYGLTTLLDDHAEVRPGSVRFTFRGKSGIAHAVDLRDRRVAGIVRRCQELPGQHLFQYVDPDGVQQAVTSRDVNEYLHAVAGPFTAKTFRTWGGTVAVTRTLLAAGAPATGTEAKANVVEAVKAAAAELRNTPAVCRRCYVHPAVVEAYSDGGFADLPMERAGELVAAADGRLDAVEGVVLALLGAEAGLAHAA